MQKVLILSSKSPYPVHDGAAIRTVQSIRFFYELGYEVDLLYISEKDDCDIVKDGLKRYCSNIYNYVITKRHSYIKVLLGLFTNRRPLQVNYFYSARIKKWIKRHQDNYDIIYCNNIRTAEYARGLRIKKILDYVDALSMNYKHSKDKIKKGIWHWIYVIDYYRCTKYECKQARIFDKIMIISEVDQKYIMNNIGDCAPTISVIENYINIDKSKRINVSLHNFNVVFVGAMNYAPNVEAVIFFVKKVLPSLVSVFPQVKFYIVGKSPRDSVKALASDNIVVTGFVDSVWDYLKQATVVVTPMLSGSGLQNKILEALAVGACVVTTKTGFEGLKNAEGKPFVASSSDEMVDIISNLFNNPKYRVACSEESVKYVESNYSKDIILEKFKVFLND